MDPQNPSIFRTWKRNLITSFCPIIGIRGQLGSPAINKFNQHIGWDSSNFILNCSNYHSFPIATRCFGNYLRVKVSLRATDFGLLKRDWGNPDCFTRSMSESTAVVCCILTGEGVDNLEVRLCNWIEFNLLHADVIFQETLLQNNYSFFVSYS